MKKLFILFIGSAIAFAAKAQTIADAKKYIYYERYKTAENVLHTLIKTDAANAEAWYWLSQAYFQQRQATRLRDTLRHCTDDVQNDPWYRVAYGHLLLAENKKDSSGFYFEQALHKTKEKNAQILMAVANAQVAEKAGDAGYAVQLIEKAIKKEKKDAALNTLYGDAYRKMGNGSEAYKMYQQALDKDGRYAAALYRMGKIFVSQKNPEMYLKYFNQVIESDSNYTPALYELYYHYYFTDAQKAMDYFKRYQAQSDYNKHNDYLYTDLLYLNKQYQAAIDRAQTLFAQQTGDSIPRLYKLMAYSYLGLKDTTNALANMNRYFAKEADTNFTAKDFEMMAEIYAGVAGKEDSAIAYYLKTVNVSKDPNALYQYYKKLADLYKFEKDYSGQAKWLGKYYENNAKATNIDLFNWGIAHFKADEYVQADTVFGFYIEKYPEQAFGYYWRARANSLQDSTMEKGLAVPWYNQLIAIIEKDPSGNKTNKKWLIEAYGYLAAYATNEVKDYKTAAEKLQKILEIDPQNKDAQQYLSILEKKISSGSNDPSASDNNEK